MGKKIGEISTDFIKLEFEYDKDRLGKSIVIIRSLWWNNQYGEWEEQQEIFLPSNKIDEIIKILNKVKELNLYYS